MDKNSKILLYNLLKEYEREKKNDTIKKLLDEIPHVEFDSAHSSQAKFKDTLIDFRFQLLFRNDKEAYKKFLTAFLYGDGVFAKFQDHFILINNKYIKKVPPPKKQEDLILPNNWIKVAKIIKE